MTKKSKLEEYLSTGKLLFGVLTFIVVCTWWIAYEHHRISVNTEKISELELEFKVDIKDIGNQVDDILKILIHQRQVHNE